jgi:hypothetical protein
MLSSFGSTAHHLFTALDVLLEVARERYRSPTMTQQRREMRVAALELTAALSDWNKFVEALSSIGDRFKFAPSEQTVISRVNQSLLDSLERLSGGSGKLVLLVFIAVWKATYVTLRGAIQLMVAIVRGASSTSRHFSHVLTSYVRSEIARLSSLSAGTAPSIRKTFLYFLSGALLVGAPIIVMTHYLFPAFWSVLVWFWGVAGSIVGAGGSGGVGGTGGLLMAITGATAMRSKL